MRVLARFRRWLKHREENRRWQCAHLHLTAFGYCPNCNRWFDEDIDGR